MLITTFDFPKNKPRVPRSPRQLSPLEVELVTEQLRLALASLALAHDPHVPAAAEQVRAALDQIGA